MKTPINPVDIRKGDLIRIEDGDDAREYRAIEHGETLWRRHLPRYLLERPAPPVDLPTEPTLGWATWSDGDLGSTDLGIWELEEGETVDGGWLRQRRRTIDDRDVTAFIPATAVRTEALEKLRKYGPGTGLYGAGELTVAIDEFLADVDQAGERA